MRTPALAIGFVLAAAAPAAAADTFKLGYVDLQRALYETDEGKNIVATLKKLFDDKQSQLNKEEEKFRKQKAQLDNDKLVLKPDTLAQREKELEARFIELQGLLVKLQKEVSEKEAELTKPILGKLQRIVQRIAERDGFAMVVQKNEAIVWARPHLDLTNEMIRMYNAEK